MDLEDQLRAVRILDGWSPDPSPVPENCQDRMGITAGGKPNWYYKYELPPYNKDLDEILRVVKGHVPDNLRATYTQNLIAVVKRSMGEGTGRGIIATFYILLATAEEHMEALLRTLGHWTERIPEEEGELTKATREFVASVKEYYKDIPAKDLTQVFARGPWAGWSEREVLEFVKTIDSNAKLPRD